MRSPADGNNTMAVWDIALPSGPSRVVGVSMAGFRDRPPYTVDLVALPYPAVTVVVEFGDRPLVVVDATGREQRGSLVAGLAPGAVRVRGRGIECIQVRLTPVVAHAVLGASGVSPAELDGRVIALEDLWGRDAERIRERLHAATSWDDRFAMMDAALARRHEAGRSVAPEVALAWDRIASSRGLLRVDELAAWVGWSYKRLWSRFRSQIGRTPKHAARLVRFDHAAHLLVAGQGAAGVAAECGYADQSHLHRDVRAFTGATPAAVAVAPWLAVDDVAWAAREDSSKTSKGGLGHSARHEEP